MTSLTDRDLKAVEEFRQRLIERLRDHKELCDMDPDSEEFKEWLSRNCSESELLLMTAWETVNGGAKAACSFLLSCQLDAQK